MQRGLMVVSVLSLLVGGVATASVQKGDTELEFSGSFVMVNGNAENEGSDVTTWSLSGAFGYFLTDNIRVAAEAGWSHETISAIPEDINGEAWSLGGSAKYHFMPTNQWVPYVGMRVLWTSEHRDFVEDADGLEWGPVAGLRFEMNANNDFFVEYQYRMWTGDIGKVQDDAHAVFAGIVHQFK